MKRISEAFLGPGDESKEKTATEDAVAHNKFPKKHKAVFVDAKAMKEKLRKNMHKKRYNVADFYYTEGRCQKIARNPMFENVTLAVITFNAFWIAVDCDLNTEEVLFKAHPVFIVAENAFCLFFFIEVSIRFGAFKSKFNCLKDTWFVFDSFMVSMMVLETWIMTIVLLIIGGSTSSGLGNASLLRLLRLMRLSRMARMARLLRAMPELLILIKGMIAATRSVIFTLALLLIIIYIFAVLMMQLTAKTDIGDQYFPSVLGAMNILALDGILYDGAGDLTSMMIEENMSWYLLPCFYTFVLLATLTVLNMLIGVLCEVINSVAICEHEELTISRVKEALEPIVARHCKGVRTEVNHDTGELEKVLELGKTEFIEILQDDATPLLLKDVKIDPLGLVDLVDTIFATEQGTDRILDFGGLVEVMMDQRETETATVKDVTELRKYIRGRMDRKEDGMEAYMNSLGKMVEKLTKQPPGTYEAEVEKAKKKMFEEKGIDLSHHEDTMQKRASSIERNISNQLLDASPAVPPQSPAGGGLLAENRFAPVQSTSGRWKARRTETE